MVAHAFNPRDWWISVNSLVYRIIPGQRYTENLSQKVKVKIKKIEVKIKPHKDGKYTENLDTV